MAEQSPIGQGYRTKLQIMLERLFDLEDLKTLCHELGVIYDDLAGDRISIKARELALLFARQNQMSALIRLCMAKRPDPAWDDLAAAAEETPNVFLATPVHESLKQLMQAPEVSEFVGEYKTRFDIAQTKLRAISYFKQLHDNIQDVETSFQLLFVERRRLPGDEQAWNDLRRNAFSLEDAIEELLEAADKRPEKVRSGPWLPLLEQGHETTPAAIKQRDLRLLDLGLGYLLRALDQGLPSVNGRLVDAAADLPLEDLVKALKDVHQRATNQRALDSQVVDEFADGIGDLEALAVELEAQVNHHGEWQILDDNLRRIEANLGEDISDLKFTFPDLKERGQRLYGISEERWARRLQESCQRLETSLAGNLPVLDDFLQYRSRASRRFRRVDDELLKLCHRLERVGLPLEILLQTIG